MGGEHLVLDPAIRDWVVFPLMLMVILVGVLRHNITALLKSEKPLDKNELSYKQTLTRAKRLRGNGRFISEEAFSRRKGYFTAKDGGLLRQDDLPGQENPMTNPEKMMGPMKSQMGFVFTNMFMMAFTSYFFEGFVLVRVPFPLTNRFKVMLQRGVHLGTLDASYVSSTSWYFLVMFGLRAAINMFLRDAAAQDEARIIQSQLGVGPSAMGFDTKKIFASEADSLDLAPHTCVLDDVEKRLLGSKYPKQSVFDLVGMHDGDAAIFGASNASSGGGGGRAGNSRGSSGGGGGHQKTSKSGKKRSSGNKRSD
ncbi:unnamed protein product [Ascophyllum nodosum]